MRKEWFIAIDMRVQLHCIVGTHVFLFYLKGVDLIASLVNMPNPFLLGPQRQGFGLIIELSFEFWIKNIPRIGDDYKVMFCNWEHPL